jgi:hypothetical protein
MTPLAQAGLQNRLGYFEKEFVPLYVVKVGRPESPIRLQVDLHFLKHTFGESDDSVVEPFVHLFDVRLRLASYSLFRGRCQLSRQVFGFCAGLIRVYQGRLFRLLSHHIKI